MPFIHWLCLGLVFSTAVDDATASVACASVDRQRSTANIRLDNDLLGGRHQDRGYTNGILLAFTGHPFDEPGDMCASWDSRATMWLVKWMFGGKKGQGSTAVSVEHAIFTPTQASRSDLIADDRPYAGVLLVSRSYSMREANLQRGVRLTIGVVGPAARGKQVQGMAHEITGGQRFLGWDHQLKDEPIFNVGYEHRHRSPTRRLMGGLESQMISRWEGQVGNLLTAAEVGGELRLGFRLPNDFGTTSFRSVGEGLVWSEGDALRQWSGHLFLGATGRLVARDVTLDGNTFANSHSVSKRPLVGVISYGVDVAKGRWRIVLSRMHATRDFDTQADAPVYGSVAVTYVL
ncbi:lipid A deacylase LpxR family protein [Xanthomonas campestris]|uniref:lipid A deacylase LpxR family protein n=1 Tax=Xanthomonas TaxID=338 RepID=UPI001E3F2812|nr:lipid A deacylase LpxR family protein [Xanthomonas campestris]MCC5090447.1 lipid A deacylase LpxR family protein [Xanthomonas campestris]